MRIDSQKFKNPLDVACRVHAPQIVRIAEMHENAFVRAQGYLEELENLFKESIIIKHFDYSVVSSKDSEGLVIRSSKKEIYIKLLENGYIQVGVLIEGQLARFEKHDLGSEGLWQPTEEICADVAKALEL